LFTSDIKIFEYFYLQFSLRDFLKLVGIISDDNGENNGIKNKMSTENLQGNVNNKYGEDFNNKYGEDFNNKYGEIKITVILI